MSNNFILSNYNQLLDELLKLFPDDTDNITSILIMDDELKMQSVELFCEYLNDKELFNLFLHKKIKVFSSKTEKTKSLSSSLYGSSLPLKNIFNNMDQEVKLTLWSYLHIIYLTKLMENKETNKDRIQMIENKINQDKFEHNNEHNNEKNKSNPLNLEVNGETNNMINDIITSFESKLQSGKGNPLDSIMEITNMINSKYQDKINNGDIELDKLLENVTANVPGLDKMVQGMKKPEKKEKVIIDENFSTDDVKVEKQEENGMDMMKMMNMFNKISSMTDGDLDMSSLMKEISKDQNLTKEQEDQMGEMMKTLDNQLNNID